MKKKSEVLADSWVIDIRDPEDKTLFTGFNRVKVVYEDGTEEESVLKEQE